MPASGSPYQHLVFVYGTLRRGESNYPYWLADPCHAIFVGTATTAQRYPFFVNLLPDYPGCSPCVLHHPVPPLTEKGEEKKEGKHQDSAHHPPASAAAGGDGCPPQEEEEEWRRRACHVDGELFLVTEAMLRWLDVLEGTDEGVYAALPAVVVPDQHSLPPMMRQPVAVAVTAAEGAGQAATAATTTTTTTTLYDLLVAPFRASHHSSSVVGGGGALVASLYFRQSHYPADWSSPTPRSSSPLLSRFSAAATLAAHGARFAGAVACHLQSPELAAAMQRGLDALPPHLLPPMATARQRRSGGGGGSDGTDEFTDCYWDAQDTALLCPSTTTTTTTGEASTCTPYGAPLRPAPMALFIIDGVGDSTYRELGHRTPLEVVAGVPPRRGDGGGGGDTTAHGNNASGIPEAHATLDLERFFPPAADLAGLATTEGGGYANPAINTVTAAGVSGLMDPYEAGLSCGSDTAHLSFFGYDPIVYYRGRGAYETLGTAVEESESDSDSDGSGDRGTVGGAKQLPPSAPPPPPPPAADPVADAAIASEKVAGWEGLRFTVGDDDVCFKSNFATFADPSEGGYGDEDATLEARCAPLTDDNGDGEVEEEDGGFPFNTRKRFLITHRRCDRDFTAEGPILCRYLSNLTIDRDVHGEPFDYPHLLKIKYATEHRCGVALSGARRVTMRSSDGDDSHDESEVVLGALSDSITGTDCLKDGLLLRQCVPTITVDGPDGPEEYARAVYTCRLVEAASEKISRYLRVHAINARRREHNRAVAAVSANGAQSQQQRKNVANIILFRGAAKKGWAPSFAARHGLSAFLVAPTCIIKGLGASCGLEVADVCPVCFPSGIGKLRRALAAAEKDSSKAPASSSPPPPSSLLECLGRANPSNSAMHGATGDYSSDLAVKVAAGLHALRLRCPARSHDHRRAAAIAVALVRRGHPAEKEGEEGKSQPHGNDDGASHELTTTTTPSLVAHPHRDFLILHVKGVDDAGHDGNPHQKLRIIGECGTAMAATFAALPTGATMAVIADHSTPLWIGDHSCEPVPVSVARKGALWAGQASAPATNSSKEGGPCSSSYSFSSYSSLSMAARVSTFMEEWRQRLPSEDEGEEEGEKGRSYLCSGCSFPSLGHLLMDSVGQRLALAPPTLSSLSSSSSSCSSPLADGVTRLGEVDAAAAAGGALGRFRGEELMGIMKKMHYYYHYM